MSDTITLKVEVEYLLTKNNKYGENDFTDSDIQEIIKNAFDLPEHERYVMINDNDDKIELDCISIEVTYDAIQ